MSDGAAAGGGATNGNGEGGVVRIGLAGGVALPPRLGDHDGARD